ncbi:MAG: hypothetical protein KAR01_12440 [Desulfocapsa sp.]|nr:hypothetical protein [Desulfocapsa sp.]
MSKNQIIIALVVLCLVGTIWGSVQDKKSDSLERQLAAMRAGAPAVADTAEHAVEATGHAAGAAVTSEPSAGALAEIEELKSQNQELLTNAATLKGSVDSQKEEIAELKKEVEGSDSSVAIEAMQTELDKNAAELASLKEAVTAATEAAATANSALEEKTAALAAAQEATAGLENVKASLANSVDNFNAKSQALAEEVEASGVRVVALEKALEERTRLLVAGGEELARTKLNMNVLLSRIAAQNDSLDILDGTRIVLEKELAVKFQIVEELQAQLSSQVVEVIVVEEAVVEEAAVVVEETAAPEAAVETEEAPAK